MRIKCTQSNPFLRDVVSNASSRESRWLHNNSFASLNARAFAFTMHTSHSIGIETMALTSLSEWHFVLDWTFGTTMQSKLNWLTMSTVNAAYHRNFMYFRFRRFSALLLLLLFFAAVWHFNCNSAERKEMKKNFTKERLVRFALSCLMPLPRQQKHERITYRVTLVIK